MPKVSYILFDCMETVIDVIEKPDVRLYARWAYDGCGHEELWENFDAFVNEYIVARDFFRSSMEKYQEPNLLDIYRLMVRRTEPIKQSAEEAAFALLQNYWRHYVLNCLVEDEVKDTLKNLSARYRCGIVSNFMVDGGIEELLQRHSVIQYFDFVVTSVRTGWKKPHSKIYDAAAALAKVPKGEILFVGDNYDCDYIGPEQFGFQTLLLDKQNTYPDIANRIEGIPDLPGYISSYSSYPSTGIVK